MTRKRRSNRPHRTPEWQLRKLRDRGPFHGQPIPEPPSAPETPPGGPLRRAWQRVIGPVLLAVFSCGIALFLVAGLLGESLQGRAEEAAFEERAVSTAATVVGVVRGEAEVVFLTEEGATVRTLLPGSFTPDDPRELVVQYLPEDPNRAYREDHRWSWQAVPAALGLLAAVGLGAGGFLLFRRRFRSRSRADSGPRSRSGSRLWGFWLPFVLLICGILSLPVGFAVHTGLRYAALADSHVVDAPVLDTGRESGSRGGCRGFVTVEYEAHGLRYEDRIRISCSDIDDYRERETVAVEFGATRPDVVRLVGRPPF
ncbi:hypothetical protein [Nocardiopsis ganjiahuensis]|uniref:hypothetical protein n=1 Tax=Nocardiopsis ganjiahuensis TaxID=239984 RepID=UPI00034BB225|nr:hypothetical protein [Nocardiopsis ganjiahuensis]